MIDIGEPYTPGMVCKVRKERIKELEKALHKTFIKLIEVCPSDLARDKELIDVFNIAEKALGINKNA